MAKLVDNQSGNIDVGVTLTSLADSYNIQFKCNSIGSGKSFIIIYATLSDATYKTYFFPIQFLGENMINFQLDSSSQYLQVKMIGDAEVNGITLEEVVNPTMEYVKANASYWDRIKEITNDIGKVRSNMLEGLINMTVNAFANESGTITQENGVMTFMDGDSPETSTQAVQITGGAIRIANTKNDGEWNWTTAISGSGINALTIIADTFSGLNISGVTITGGTITGGTINGVTINGGSLFAGNVDGGNGSYVEITQDGVIKGFNRGKKTIHIDHASEGRVFVGTDIDGDNNEPYLELNAQVDYNGSLYPGINVHANAFVINVPRLVVTGDIIHTGELRTE